MTLSTWIQKTGPEKAAKILKVKQNTISSWNTLTKLPRPANMIKIYKVTRGKVTYRTMIESYHAANK